MKKKECDGQVLLSLSWPVWSLGFLLQFEPCVPCFLCCSEGRKKGVYHLLKEFFEAEKFQCVDMFVACELRGDVELFLHPSFVVIDTAAAQSTQFCFCDSFFDKRLGVFRRASSQLTVSFRVCSKFDIFRLHVDSSWVFLFFTEFHTSVVSVVLPEAILSLIISLSFFS